MNNIILTGRLTKDVEMRYIPVTGTPVATFTLAVQRDYLKKDGTLVYYELETNPGLNKIVYNTLIE